MKYLNNLNPNAGKYDLRYATNRSYNITWVPIKKTTVVGNKSRVLKAGKRQRRRRSLRIAAAIRKDPTLARRGHRRSSRIQAKIKGQYEKNHPKPIMVITSLATSDPA